MTGIEIYKIKVALMYNKRTYRHIEIADNQTFADLHEAIFDAFDRYEEHLYSFFFPGKRTKSIRMLYNSPEVTHPMNVQEMAGMLGKEIHRADDTTILQSQLAEGEFFYYLFDFGDEWWHELTVLKSDTGRRSEKELPRVVKKNGPSPEQYPDFEEDDEP
jgi:Plasmid pRiA4b ORF-3-like protein